jgi:colanic acid/amylovoran biosynthesis glycosyltransferase
MRTIAYITNMFPSPVEPYVAEEIAELRRRGVAVIPCSAHRPDDGTDFELKSWSSETNYILPLRLAHSIRAGWLCVRKLPLLSDILVRTLFRGTESPSRKLKAILHTFLGAYLAVLLEPAEVDHIQVHHGYFASWIAMVAARLRGITYSVTLHGSDLLLHKAYLDTKLRNCHFCTTVSEFNRDYIIDHYRWIDPQKIFIRRMGVDTTRTSSPNVLQPSLVMLAVGRLHRVKNHAFLIKACARLKRRGRPFACLIAGEGKERTSLQILIQRLGLEHEVILLGHLSRSKLNAFYENSNLVVLTSRSEGLPLALMEAMARGKTVLAPSISGIPELVMNGQNGFLFREGSIDDFLDQIEKLRSSSPDILRNIGAAARKTISKSFDRSTNQAAFVDLLLQQTANFAQNGPHENLVLQQI